jgi:NhaP-type Na+/H+ and K+/H+ antiporter
MTLDSLAPALLIGAGVVLVAVVGIRLARRLRVPSLLLFLVIGLGLGTLAPDFDSATPSWAWCSGIPLWS